MRKFSRAVAALALLLLASGRPQAAPPAAPAPPEIGVTGLLASLDAAAGYDGTEDDFREAAAAGITLATHDLTLEGDYPNLSAWLALHAETKARYETLKSSPRPELAWPILLWESCLADAHAQTKGKLKVVVGPLYDVVAPPKKGLDPAAVAALVAALCAAEKDKYPGTIGGWLLTDAPLAPAHGHDPAVVAAVAAALADEEKKGGFPRHRTFVGLSPSDPPDKVAPFLAPADVALVSPDAWLWSRNPPAKVDDAVYESIPHAVRAVRDLAEKAKKKDLKVHVALQAFDRVEDEVLQPSHLEMHQQLRCALSPGLANRGPYARAAKQVPPAEGIWLTSWREMKWKRAGKELNLWDDPTGANWSEALVTELAGAPGAVHVVKDETWSSLNHVAGDIIVHKGATLTLSPGTQLRFSPVDHYSGGIDKSKCELVVEGKLVVKGTEQINVLFTSDAENAGFSETPRPPHRGDWVGIRVAGGTVETKNDKIYKIEHAVSDKFR